MNTNPAAHLAATTETETQMGRMKDLAIDLEHAYAEWVGEVEPEAEHATALDRDAYMAWAGDRIADGDTPDEVTPEAYTDYLVGYAEQAAEDAAWRAGCGPSRGVLA